MRRILSILFILLITCLRVHAQETAVPPTGVYVTTQDFSVLRGEPSRMGERLAVLPPATTLPAVGRSPLTDWIQVSVDGEMGWIAAHLLIWSGDILELPVDGVVETPFVRRAVVWAHTFRETPYYRLSSLTQLGTIPAESEFEVIGRLGTGEWFWVQITYQGQQVWIGSWDVQVVEGSLGRTLNANYRYAFGRLINRLRADVQQGSESLNQINALWLQLASGQPVPCAPLPASAGRLAVDRDITLEPIFRPVALALDDAIREINAAITRLDDICSTPNAVVTVDDVDTALPGLASAARSLTLARALLNELRNRDPLFN